MDLKPNTIKSRKPKSLPMGDNKKSILYLKRVIGELSSGLFSPSEGLKLHSL